MNYLDDAVTKSLDEFMEFYKITDNEKIYSNGIDYVPIFRIKQWYEYNNKDKEIERLNNIINELESYIEESKHLASGVYEFKGSAYMFYYNKTDDLLDKIKELKGSVK